MKSTVLNVSESEVNQRATAFDLWFQAKAREAAGDALPGAPSDDEMTIELDALMDEIEESKARQGSAER